MTNQKIPLLFFGTLAGLAAYTIIGSLGLYLLRIGWADYAAHSEDKSYTLEMLLSRLSVGMLAAVIAGITAEKTANDNGRSVWFVGTIVFCAGSYVHFITAVWDGISCLVSFCLCAADHTNHRTKPLFSWQKEIEL